MVFLTFSMIFSYLSPRFLGPSQGDHLWGQSCFNCATYPASVGLPIPDDSGMLPQYLVKLLQEGARRGIWVGLGGELYPAWLCQTVRYWKWPSRNSWFSHKTWRFWGIHGIYIYIIWLRITMNYHIFLSLFGNFIIMVYIYMVYFPI